MTDHTDLALAAFAASGLQPTPPFRTPAAVLNQYLIPLLAMLPPAEGAGYVKSKPGAENTAALPDGTLVRCSRLMYASGAMAKVLVDSPNGGPEWADEGMDDPALFLPYGGTHTDPPVVDDPPAPPVDLAPLWAEINALKIVFDALGKQLETVNNQIAGLTNNPALKDHHHKVSVPIFGTRETGSPL